MNCQSPASSEYSACLIGEKLSAAWKVTWSSPFASVAVNPDGDFHFHRGPHYAARQLGYELDELLALPSIATAPFAGVGNPFKMGRLAKGLTVIDIGSGANWDRAH